MLTHIVRHIFRMATPMNFNRGTRMEDDDRQALWPPRSKVKVARSRDQSEPSLGPMLYLCHLRPAGAYRVGRTRRPHFLLYAYFSFNDIICTISVRCNLWTFNVVYVVYTTTRRNYTVFGKKGPTIRVTAEILSVPFFRTRCSYAVSSYIKHVSVLHAFLACT